MFLKASKDFNIVLHHDVNNAEKIEKLEDHNYFIHIFAYIQLFSIMIEKNSKKRGDEQTVPCFRFNRVEMKFLNDFIDDDDIYWVNTLIYFHWYKYSRLYKGRIQI